MVVNIPVTPEEARTFSECRAHIEEHLKAALLEAWRAYADKLEYELIHGTSALTDPVGIFGAKEDAPPPVPRGGESDGWEADNRRLRSELAEAQELAFDPDLPGAASLRQWPALDIPLGIVVH